MPKIIGSQTKIKLGWKVQVKSNVKSFIRGGHAVSWYYAIQIWTEEEGFICILMTKAEYDSAKVIKKNFPNSEFAIPKEEGCSVFLALYDETTKSDVYLKFYKNVFLRAKARSEKYPDLCPKIGFWEKLFSR